MHWRVRSRQNRKHEESDSIFGLRGRVETQVQRGKLTRSSINGNGFSAARRIHCSLTYTRSPGEDTRSRDELNRPQFIRAI